MNLKNGLNFRGIVVWTLVVFGAGMSILEISTRADAWTALFSNSSLTVDSDLIVKPGPGAFADGPLARRAIERAYTKEVRVQLNHLLTVKREDIRRSISLSSRYVKHMEPVLKQNGLPAELAYLCIIESGYRSFARSHAGATGMWQMIRATSRRFGLRTDAWEDQRLDFVMSTEGAARYFKYLKKRFHDWDLVLAAYNAGEGRVQAAINRARRMGLKGDFEDLQLPRETRIYVPAFYASLLVVMEPERYGIFPDYQPPIDFQEVNVPGGVKLASLEAEFGTPGGVLKALNPSLIKGRVPPNKAGYSLRVPCSLDTGLALKVVRSLEEVRWITYRVRKGDTLWDISKRYGVSAHRIDRTRKMRRPSVIFPGEILMIPVIRGLELGKTTNPLKIKES
ncbi:MAG: transglycosylase SLT domain-containing protein [Deltaproteobacteria bacterium]|nr:transglycosylase SLT domain-containing protein [Deltaproteobacteria bacterium]